MVSMLLVGTATGTLIGGWLTSEFSSFATAFRNSTSNPEQCDWDTLRLVTFRPGELSPLVHFRLRIDCTCRKCSEKRTALCCCSETGPNANLYLPEETAFGLIARTAEKRELMSASKFRLSMTSCFDPNRAQSSRLRQAAAATASERFLASLTQAFAIGMDEDYLESSLTDLTGDGTYDLTNILKAGMRSLNSPEPGTTGSSNSTNQKKDTPTDPTTMTDAPNPIGPETGPTGSIETTPEPPKGGVSRTPSATPSDDAATRAQEQDGNLSEADEWPAKIEPDPQKPEPTKDAQPEVFVDLTFHNPPPLTLDPTANPTRTCATDVNGQLTGEVVPSQMHHGVYRTINPTGSNVGVVGDNGFGNLLRTAETRYSRKKRWCANDPPKEIDNGIRAVYATIKAEYFEPRVVDGKSLPSRFQSFLNENPHLVQLENLLPPHKCAKDTLENFMKTSIYHDAHLRLQTQTIFTKIECEDFVKNLDESEKKFRMRYVIAGSQGGFESDALSVFKAFEKMYFADRPGMCIKNGAKDHAVQNALLYMKHGLKATHNESHHDRVKRAYGKMSDFGSFDASLGKVAYYEYNYLITPIVNTAIDYVYASHRDALRIAVAACHKRGGLSKLTTEAPHPADKDCLSFAKKVKKAYGVRVYVYMLLQRFTGFRGTSSFNYIANEALELTFFDPKRARYNYQNLLAAGKARKMAYGEGAPHRSEMGGPKTSARIIVKIGERKATPKEIEEKKKRAAKGQKCDVNALVDITRSIEYSPTKEGDDDFGVMLPDHGWKGKEFQDWCEATSQRAASAGSDLIPIMQRLNETRMLEFCGYDIKMGIEEDCWQGYTSPLRNIPKFGVKVGPPKPKTLALETALWLATMAVESDSWPAYSQRLAAAARRIATTVRTTGKVIIEDRDLAYKLGELDTTDGPIATIARVLSKRSAWNGTKITTPLLGLEGMEAWQRELSCCEQYFAA